MGSKTVSASYRVLPALLCAILTLGLATAAFADPYFALDTQRSWQEALTAEIQPMTAPEWSDYMSQWSAFHVEGDYYPTNEFRPPELYIYAGGGGGGGALDPEEPGLVMVWGEESPAPGSYSSAWKYDYGLDPNLANAVINVTILAPQFNPAGNQINVVSLGIRDVAGNIRSWSWNCGPGKPIPWNVATNIALTPNIMGVGAAVPMASGFANNPVFNIMNSQVLIADENAAWVGGPGFIPPPGMINPRIWNYWSNLTVLPNGAQFDWGDAPDGPFPTLAISNGARHALGNLMLGAIIDAEANGQPHPMAMGDDLAGVADEDGVVFITPLVPGMPATANVTASMPGVLDAWIDFLGDGVWGPGDQIAAAMPLPAGVIPVGFFVPAAAVPGTTTFARFRLSSAGGLGPQGIAVDGEVEDYQVFISQGQEDKFDWGDAPDPTFPTLSASAGANHKILQGMCLGALIDAEPDGQPDSKALGDDNNGVDDEDGVAFNTPLLPGGNATIAVTASLPGFLEAWIDFNGSGIWADAAGEQICMAMPLIGGPNAITFPVPAYAVPGSKVFARFRYSSLGGLPFSGPAPDGEVEDYLVEIGYKWVQKPDLSTDGIDINATAPYILADDFLCTTTGLITDIHIWGSWYHDQLPVQMPENVVFRLSIHEDIPAGPGAPSHPGKLLWYHEFLPGGFAARQYATDIDEGWMDPPAEWEPIGDHICWEYDFDISEFPFYQTGTEQSPKVYWVDVQAQPGEPGVFFGWKTSVTHWNDDAVWGQGNEPYPGPWNELRYPPQHPHQGESIDLAFAVTGKLGPPPPGKLSVTYNKLIADHIWWPSTDPYNEMGSLLVTADPTEAILWNSIDLQAFGSGNDALDIASVDVWLDGDNDGAVGLADTPIGSGVYAVDNGLLSIALSSPQVIPAGGSVPVVISYTMGPAPSFGSRYGFDVTAALGTGQTSGAIIAAAITPTPLRSAIKTASTPPIKIGPAKQLPVGTPFLLVDKEITADFLPPTWPNPWNWWYIEEPDRSSGIGVIGGLTGPLHVGDRVTVMGACTLVNGAELMITPIHVAVTYHDATVGVLGMNGKATGGAAFGGQPGLLDDAWAIPVSWSHGLNNVGMLMRIYGGITGSGRVSLGGGNLVDVVWIDDGSKLHDGYNTTLPGGHSQGIAVVVPTGTPVVPSGYWMMQGILRAVANPLGSPVRLLVPRSFATDMIPDPGP